MSVDNLWWHLFRGCDRVDGGVCASCVIVIQHFSDIINSLHISGCETKCIKVQAVNP
jgi:hypothetical protein